MVERDLGSALAKRFRRLLLALMSVLKALREKEVLFDFSSTSDDIYYFLEVLTVTDLNLKKVFEMNGKFTKSETDFSNQVERLRQLLNGTQLVERSLGAKMTVWNFLKNFDILGKGKSSETTFKAVIERGKVYFERFFNFFIVLFWVREVILKFYSN